jgi:UrcA family protein
MTTFTVNSVRAAVLTALGVLGSAAAMAQQPPAAVESASAKTSLAGLDLATPEGMAAVSGCIRRRGGCAREWRTRRTSRPSRTSSNVWTRR